MRPHADLYVFDEANSALDAAAQNELFERITNGCVTSVNGQTRKKTVIYVTHRLSTVRKADKSACSDPSFSNRFDSPSLFLLVAMFENGVGVFSLPRKTHHLDLPTDHHRIWLA